MGLLDNIISSFSTSPEARMAANDASLLKSRDANDAYFAERQRMRETGERDFTGPEFAKFMAEMTPILGDGIAAKEVWDEATSATPNWPLVLALGGATAIGLIPGAGDAIAKSVKSGARGLLDTVQRVEVDPNAMGSLLGNVRLKPRVISPAQNVADLLASGRIDEVTDELLGNLTPNDNMELFKLYESGATGMDLPMDTVSRMARAIDSGFEANMFHGTGADIVSVDRSKLGQKQNVLGEGFYQTTSRLRPDNYVPKETDANTKKRIFSEGGNVLPLMSKSNFEFDLTKPTGSENALKIGKVFEGQDFDVEFKGNGDQVFIKRKSDPKKQVYIDSYQGGLETVQRLKDEFGNNNVTNILEEAGFSGLRSAEAFGEITKVNYKPEDIRSQFARFDPRLAHLKNLSAAVGIAPAGLLALQEAQKRANEKQYRQGLLQ